jgi:hypothetical protein
MKIELLSIDGMARAAEAWRLSRDVKKDIEWADIFTVDGPVNEFPSAVCHFRDFTILEREIFASLRNHVIWARTSFVDAPEKYTVPDDLLVFIKGVMHDHYRFAMQKGKASGQHQDVWRRHLPISAETCFSMRISYRDAIKMGKYFTYLTSKATFPLVTRFVNIAEELSVLVDKFTGSRMMTGQAKDTMNLAKLLHEGDILPAPLHDVGGVIVATFEVPFWIRAHFIRHRPITVADTLFQILQDPDVLNLQINTPITMQVAASHNIWQQLLGSRSCWLTQSTLYDERDPWDAIVSQFDVKSVLPCSGGTCPHHRDARNRLEKTDPGIPCPRYMNLNSIDKEPWMDLLRQAVRSRGKFWLEEITINS